MAKDTKPRRRSIAHLSAAINDPIVAAYQKTYVHRFVDDVRLHIMPIGGRTSYRDDFVIRLTTSNAKHYEFLSSALHTPGAGSDRWDFQKTITEFVAQCAMHLALYGRAYYEVCTTANVSEQQQELDADGQSQLREFWLYHIPGAVKKKGQFFHQLIPLAEQAKYGAKVVSLPEDSVLCLEIPPSLGGYKIHQRMILILAKTSDFMPEFAQEQISGKGMTSKDFRLKDYSRATTIERARAMAPWGDIIDFSDEENTLQYFRVYRFLYFYRAMSLLRDYIVWQLNSLLEKMRYPCRIVINGLPTVNEIEDHINRLSKGDLSFNEALNKVQY